VSTLIGCAHVRLSNPKTFSKIQAAPRILKQISSLAIDWRLRRRAEERQPFPRMHGCVRAVSLGMKQSHDHLLAISLYIRCLRT
jgi:hypothetical protein